MELLPKEIADALPPLRSQDGLGLDATAHLKLFTPDAGWTWSVTEGEPAEGTWELFGKVVSPFVPDGELGYFWLAELESVRGPLGLPIERDLHFEARPLRDCR